MIIDEISGDCMRVAKKRTSSFAERAVSCDPRGIAWVLANSKKPSKIEDPANASKEANGGKPMKGRKAAVVSRAGWSSRLVPSITISSRARVRGAQG